MDWRFTKRLLITELTVDSTNPVEMVLPALIPFPIIGNELTIVHDIRVKLLPGLFEL